jgi:hypothetical protein
MKPLESRRTRWTRALPAFDVDAAIRAPFPAAVDFGRGFAFPCDALGQVPLNDLSDRLRDNYLYARAVVGNELSWPVVNRLDS